MGVTLFLLGLATCAAASYRLTVDWHNQLMRWSPVFFCGLLAACLGADLAQGYLRIRGRVKAGSNSRRRMVIEATAFILILAAAVWLRAYRLDWFPPPDGVTTTEEPQFGSFSYRIVHQNYRHWEWMQTSYPGALTFYFLGPSLVNARIHGVVFGILTLVPFYLLLRRLWGIKAALFATALLAACVWHFTYSRYNDAVYHGVLFATVCVALLVYSCRSPRLSLVLWLGFFAALELYDYDAFKGTPVFVLVFLGARWASSAFSVLRSRKSGKVRAVLCLLKRGWRKPALLLLMMVLVSAPIINQAMKEPNRYFNGIRRATGDEEGKSYYDTSEWGKFLGKRWLRLRDISKVFFYKAGCGQYCVVIIPEDPMLDLITRTLLVLALAYALLHPLRRHSWFFLMMFCMVIIGGGIVTKNLDVRRLGCIVPYTYILIGLFAGKLFSRLDGAYPRKKLGRLLFVLLMACALANGIANYRYAFGRVYPHFLVPGEFKNVYTTLVKHMKKLPRGSSVVVVSHLDPANNRIREYEWLGAHHVNWKFVREFEDIFPLLDHPRPVVIFQAPYDVEALSARLRELYPDAVCSFSTDPRRADLKVAVCALYPGDSTGRAVATMKEASEEERRRRGLEKSPLNVALDKSYVVNPKPYGYTDTYATDATDGKKPESKESCFGYNGVNTSLDVTLDVDLGQREKICGAALYTFFDNFNDVDNTCNYGANYVEVYGSDSGDFRGEEMLLGRAGTKRVSFGAPGNSLFEIEFAPRECRYVRFMINKIFGDGSTGTDWLFIKEVEVLRAPD